MNARRFLRPGLLALSCGPIAWDRKVRGPALCETKLSGKFVALNRHETDSVQLPPPATVTLYKGPCPSAWLHARVAEITAANPWLGGRLRTDPQSGKLAAWVPDEPQAEGVEDLFEVITLANEAAIMECESAQFIVKAGTDQTATDGTSICRIAVVTEPTQHLWKLHVSLSHAVADAQTLYMVYGMLDERAEVRPLEVERVSFNPATCLGQVPFHGKWLFFVVRRFCFFLTGLFKDTRQARPVIRVRYVREEWLRDQKSKHIAEVDAMYVSSSDLLTSWFLSVTQPACGVMAMDMRDRMPGLGKAHAGVYTTLLMFYPEEYKSAANIRRALTRQSPACMPDGSCQAPGSSSRFAFVTAWHSNYCEVAFNGCTQLSHCPVTSVWKDYDAAQFPCAVIFRPSAGTLAMCTVSGEELPPGPLGEAVPGTETAS
ncbi:bacA [Symbiodinium sp. CCMP2456]|nr:bacA [Symbiodinium sp. CCMP2456]